MDTDNSDYATRTERIKNLLSSYYGSSDGSQTQGPVHAAAGYDVSGQPDNSYSTRVPATALDSPASNPERHILLMLKSYPLEKLLGEHRGMAREIKNLDSDMQQLVYENYNKFIAATDTIRAMKSNVDSMETDMNKLKVIMGRWSACR